MREINKFILGITDCCDLSYENAIITCREDVKSVIKKRVRDSHKGTYGRVGMLSGSKGMAGACVLNLNSALRSGSGLVKGLIPESIYEIVEAMSLESITYPFDENKISPEEIKGELIHFADVIATGSGCTNLKNYKILLEFLIENANQPMVIDAEGINQLELEKLKGHKQIIVLTPHYGEFSRLINSDIDYIRENILEITREFAAQYNVYLVLKGARTVISCPDGDVFINTTGNPGMATAGSGDVLTGIIASFIGQRIEIKNALMAAVYMHGLSGDIGKNHVGEYSLIAGDIIKYLPDAFNCILDR